MDFLLRRALNPWGDSVPIGASWDLIWVAVVLGAVFVVGHALMVPKKVPAVIIDPEEAKGLPDRVQRHTLGARWFHWSMSATMFVLLITAFFPVLGIQFPWVTIHWIAGVLLACTLVYHLVHVFWKQDFWSMWISGRDVREGRQGLQAALRRRGERRPRAGKYPVDQKMFHHAATVVTLGAVVTGALMMFRVEQFLWSTNTYMFSDAVWGWIYVIHGFCGIGLIVLVIAHVYFAVRPEKRWMTWSMINGWIHRDRYLEHHDPERWAVAGQGVRAGVAGPETPDDAVVPHDATEPDAGKGSP